MPFLKNEQEQALVVGLVDSDRGLVDRRIFSDEAIYQQELEQIFARCWLFLGHESEIPRPGDFLTTWMGEDGVIVCRDTHGQLRAFLNSCRHRGNRVTRLDRGRAHSFMCTYHGWTYDLEGKLVGVPGYEECYHGELDRSLWGLVPVAQLDTYKGLIFATWDHTAPPLLEYLDEDIRWGLDMSLDRRAGGTEVVGGVFKWLVPCNWKFPVDNAAGDNYHGPTSHRSNRLVLNRFRDNSAIAGTKLNFKVSSRYGHGYTYARGEDARGRERHGEIEVLREYRQQIRAEVEERLGTLRARELGAQGMAIFPNFFPPSLVFHPRGPLHTEVWIYNLVDKDAPSEVKSLMRRLSNQQGMSPGGMMAQDDIENWQGSTLASLGAVGRRYPLNYQMGVGHDQLIRDGLTPPRVEGLSGEYPQRRLYKVWADMMAGKSWDEIGR